MSAERATLRYSQQNNPASREERRAHLQKRCSGTDQLLSVLADPNRVAVPLDPDSSGFATTVGCMTLAGSAPTRFSYAVKAVGKPTGTRLRGCLSRGDSQQEQGSCQANDNLFHDRHPFSPRSIGTAERRQWGIQTQRESVMYACPTGSRIKRTPVLPDTSDVT